MNKLVVNIITFSLKNKMFILVSKSHYREKYQTKIIGLIFINERIEIGTSQIFFIYCFEFILQAIV